MGALVGSSAFAFSPRGHGIPAAAALVSGIFLFLFLAEYSRKETVAGYLTPAAGTARIFVPHQGVVRTVHVNEGQEVQEGQPLLTIDTNQIAATGEDINATMLETLSHQRKLLDEQVRGEEQRTKAEQQRLTALIRGLETELTHLRSQLALQTERIHLAETLVGPAAQLSAKGYMSDVELKRRQE